MASLKANCQKAFTALSGTKRNRKGFAEFAGAENFLARELPEWLAHECSISSLIPWPEQNCIACPAYGKSRKGAGKAAFGRLRRIQRRKVKRKPC